MDPLDGQPLAPPASSSLQNVLAIGRAHSNAEAVRLMPLSLVGLEGAFHAAVSSLLGLDGLLYPIHAKGTSRPPLSS